MSARQITQCFENYQKSRVQFVQTVADLANRAQNIETLQACGVMSLLRPLLLDPSETVQQTAALALGRLANIDDDLASQVVTGDLLPQLVYSLAEGNRFFKKAACFVLRSVAKRSEQNAQAVVDSGALEALVTALEELDPAVQEASGWALGYIARHNAELAQAVIDAGAVPNLMQCLQEPEISLKRISASALSDIAKHSPQHAQTVVDNGAIAYLAQLVTSPDAKLKRQVFSALSQIAKHSTDLAEMVVEAEVFPVVLPSLRDTDEYVKKNVATLVREVVKHSPELSQLLVNTGGVAAIVDYVSESSGNARMPGIMALGFIASFNERLAMSVIVSHGIPPLANALRAESEDHVRAAAAWSLGQLGQHTPEHARHVAEANVFPTLVEIARDEGASPDLRQKANRALQNVLRKCVHLPALEALLSIASPSILQHVVGQFAKVLPHDAKARRNFVTSGLKKVQEISADPGTELAESIQAINDTFPSEIVEYYKPGYSDTLLQRVEEYQPSSTLKA